MESTPHRHVLRNLSKSKFVRSVFLQIASIVLVVVIAIVAIVFFYLRNP